VTSRYLLAVFDSAYVLAMTAWVGSILFFSFGVAPIIFNVLGAEAGGKFVRVLFPRYYLWGAISGAVALPSLVAVPLCYPEYRGPMVGVQALAIIGCILIMLYAGNSLTPAINRARDAGLSGHRRFEQLHRRSVRLNALVLVVGLGLLIGFATRRAPRTSGIIEMNPSERLRYDEAVNRVIQDVEAKYGMRPPRVDEAGKPADAEPVIDAETVKEIDSIFAQKRLRDEVRAKRRSAAPTSRVPSTAAPPQSPSATTPGPARPASSGEPRGN
jgi:hypothetical protein